MNQRGWVVFFVTTLIYLPFMIVDFLIFMTVYGVTGCIGGIRGAHESAGLLQHGLLHQTDEGDHSQTCGGGSGHPEGEGETDHGAALYRQYQRLHIDKAQEDQLDDGGGDHDPYHHRDGVRDLIHLNLHFSIPLASHDPTHETQHQPPGSDLHWIGGDS